MSKRAEAFPCPRKVAILFRYGAGEHVHFLPALPDLVRQLSAKGIEVHHFGFKGGRELPAELSENLIIHEGPFRVRRQSGWDKHLKAFLWLCGLPWLGWACSRKGFDVVFVDETLPLSALLMRWGYRGKLMFTVHDFFMEIYWEKSRWLRLPGQWIQKIDLAAWRKLDRIFTRVEAAKIHLVKNGIASEKISVVPDSVDLELFIPSKHAGSRRDTRIKFGVDEKNFLLVHHGIMHPNKGNVRLVRAVADLRERLPNMKLLLIGDGPEMKDLRKEVSELKLEDRVILTGWLPGMRALSEALQASDVGLVMRKGLPGDHFHVTSTLVHNLACGLPILAARLDGVVAALENSGAGELFDPDCQEEFKQKLLEFAMNPAKRVACGQKARTLAETKFGPQKIAAMYAEWICQ